MKPAELLQEISDYCRWAGLAESTFGRQAVNDGKLVRRLREGGRITTDTLERIRAFLANRPPEPLYADAVTGQTFNSSTAALAKAPTRANGAGEKDPGRNFRFFDNRQKYLLFVSTCSEKRVIAQRVGLELANIHPRPPAVRSIYRRSLYERG